MALAIIQAGIILAVAILCLFFRYKDGSAFGSITAGILFFILSAMLISGYTYETGARTSTYQNVTTYDVAHSCIDVRNESWDEIELDGSDCGAGQITETGTFRRTAVLLSETPVTQTVNDITTSAFSIISLCAGLLFFIDAFGLILSPKKN